PGEIARQKSMLPEGDAARLIEIFRNDLGVRDGRAVFFQQDRKGASRIEGEEFMPPIPRLLFHKAGRGAVFAERQAHEPGIWAQWLMKQDQHARVRRIWISWKRMPSQTHKKALTPRKTGARLCVANAFPLLGRHASAKSLGGARRGNETVAG